jgi:uncharacterized cupin superfamily protein
MAEVLRVIRMEPTANLGDWSPMTYDGVLTTGAMDRSSEVFTQIREGKNSVRVGVWEAKPYKEQLVDYACDEFMYVIEGSCVITGADGNEEIFKAGESFFMPRGFNGFWAQNETMKKYYMIVEAR